MIASAISCYCSCSRRCSLSLALSTRSLALLLLVLGLLRADDLLDLDFLEDVVVVDGLACVLRGLWVRVRGGGSVGGW